jgi:DNA-binding NarL/FixJ family response regulator
LHRPSRACETNTVSDACSPNQTARVLLVDDHPLFRTGLETVLSAVPQVKVVGHAGSLDETLQTIANLGVDLAIIDIVLPHADGIAVTRALRERCSSPKILGLSVLDEPVRVAALLRAGASSFALKTQPVAEIVEAIRITLSGGRYLSPAMRDAVEHLLRQDIKLPLEMLTPREREVFEMLVAGSSNERAAQSLGIAARTVETHRQRIMKKLDAHSMADLVRLAARWGALG